LLAEPVRGTWVRALERPALVAVIIGTAVTMSSALRSSIGLVSMGILCWSFVPIIQLVIGAIVIGRARGRSISMRRALELLFIGQLPWSLWLLTMVGVYTFAPVGIPRAVEVLSLLVPGTWTTVIVFAFCRMALGATLVQARLLTVAHQVMTWTIFSGYILLLTGLWARTLALVGA
jgi:hypothetical protein